jgi:hypothetical protein
LDRNYHKELPLMTNITKLFRSAPSSDVFNVDLEVSDQLQDKYEDELREAHDIELGGIHMLGVTIDPEGNIQLDQGHIYGAFLEFEQELFAQYTPVIQFEADRMIRAGEIEVLGVDPETYKGLRYSGKNPVPALGQEVEATINNLGRGVVVGYQAIDGYLGVNVELTNPPKWHVRDNGGRTTGLLFGVEIDPSPAPEAPELTERARPVSLSWADDCEGLDTTAYRFHADGLDLETEVGEITEIMKDVGYKSTSLGKVWFSRERGKDVELIIALSNRGYLPKHSGTVPATVKDYLETGKRPDAEIAKRKSGPSFSKSKPQREPSTPSMSM